MADDNDPGDDVRLVISETGEWIRNADTKTGLLATALAVFMGFASQRAQDVDTFPPFHNWIQYTAFCFLVIAVATAALAYFFFYRTLFPRVNVPGSGSRFAWPWLAAASPTALSSLATTTVREEAWEQARILALICKAKFRFFTHAMTASAYSVISILLWLIVVSIE